MTTQLEPERYGQVNESARERFQRAEPADDAPFYMLNLMRYRPWAEYDDDRQPRITGREADDRYAPIAILQELGAEIVLFGDVVDQPRGDERWDRVAIVRYPHVRSFVEMQRREDFQALHVHKQAGMDLTVIAACRPSDVEVALQPTGGRLVVDLVRGEPDDLDGECAGLLDVEASLVGDGREWDLLRLSRVVGADLPLLTGVDDATTVVMTPLIDTVTESLQATRVGS